jgi:hypothetical protein
LLPSIWGPIDKKDDPYAPLSKGCDILWHEEKWRRVWRLWMVEQVHHVCYRESGELASSVQLCLL